MFKLLASPMVVRQLTTKSSIMRSSRRNLYYSPSILQPINITSNSWSEFHNPSAVLDVAKQSPFQNHSNLPIQSAWRHYSSDKGGKGGKGGNSNSSAASGDSNDGSEKKPYYDEDQSDIDNDSDYFSDEDEKSLTVTKVPDEFPNVPILATAYPLFPKFMKVFEVNDQALGKLIWNQFQSGFPYAGVFARRLGDATNHITEIKELDEVHHIGSFVKITEMTLEGGKYRFVATAHRRIQINQEVHLKQHKLIDAAADGFDLASLITEHGEPKWNVVLVNTQNIKEEFPDIHSDKYKAVSMEMVKTIRDIILSSSLIRDNLYLLLGNNLRVNDDPSYLADLSASITSAKPEEMQEILALPNVDKRMELALELLIKEKQVLELQRKIGKEVEEKVKASHREFMLREQLKAIKIELGLQKEDGVALEDKYRKELQNKTVPSHVLITINEEISKLAYLDHNASEFAVTRNYLEWLTCLPWGVRSEDKFDISSASAILEEDHYGMEKIKERILEFIAVSQLRGTTQGKILCFYGPPGVGKTSIAKSIAKALNREYYRFSVGGLSDVAEIKGHRRTYVGAMPGKIIQCLKKTKTENPLVLIDEIDKIGSRSHGGEPSSALLELLDPEQNCNFVDHYLDVAVDLSKVLFICTANVLDTIPDPLRDRMELIEMSGYVGEEKLAIAKQYLIPTARKEMGLNDDQIKIDDSAVFALIKSYCRESGVRNLQKHLEKVIRKVAFKIVKKETDRMDVTESTVESLVGTPVFTHDRIYEETPPGVVMGLAWTSLGGSTLFIETAKRKVFESPDSTGKAESGSLQITGHLGDVMKESSQIALTVARNFLHHIEPTNTFLETTHMHLHVPEGATKKDGPSAGITIVTALISLALNKSTRQNIAMTGEVSLTGKVLPVGGIKEKIIAAKRVGVHCIILPAENRKDYSELADFITKDVEVHFVSNYSDVYQIVFQ